MKSFQKFLPKYSIALAVLFVAMVYLLMTKGNSVDIEAEELSGSELVQAVYATGFIEPDAVASLIAESSGTVSFVGATEGQRVIAGQTIIGLENSQFHLALSQAKAALAEQQALVRDNRLKTSRKNSLLREGAISRQEFEEAARNSVQSEELFQQRLFQLKIREDDLKKTTIKAPFSGILTLQNVKKGDYVTINSLVARIVDPSRFMVNVEVDELDVPKIRNGQAATVAFDAYPEKRFSAVVSRIVPQTDRVTKTSRIYLTVVQPPDNIQAGMTVTANIIYNTRKNALLVRKTSVFEENRQSFVWKIQNRRLKKQPVRLGDSDMSFVEVLQGLKKGDKIVLSPEKNLHEGVEVNIVQGKKP